MGDSSPSGISAEHLGPTLAALHRARALASEPDAASAWPELVALQLREAWEPLESFARGPLAEDILERIESRFCIGK